MLEIAEKQGVPPPALEKKPELTLYQTWLVTEFGQLSRDRRYTDGGPLPLHTGAIHKYYEAFKMQDIGFENFYAWMTTIDSIWLDQVAKRRKKEQGASPQKGKPPPKRRG